MYSNSAPIPLNLSAQVVRQIADAIITAASRGDDPKKAEQAMIARLQPVSIR